MRRYGGYLFFCLASLGLVNLALAEDICKSPTAEALRQYGLVLYKSGDLPDAQHEFRKCLLIEPECSGCSRYLEEKVAAAATPSAKPTAKSAAPVAVMAKEPLSECFSFIFDGSKSYDPDGKIISYQWDFGDGEKAEGAQVTHTYKKSGRYKVVLTVMDDSQLECNQATITEDLIVTGAPEIEIEVPAPGCPDEEIAFKAKVKSSTASPENLKVNWDFGDGTTAEGTTVRHKYAKGGLYTVKAEVKDMVSLSGCDTNSTETKIKINTPPVAEAGKDILACFPQQNKLEVRFDGSSSYDPDGDSLEYLWDFGDGASSNLVKPVHVYRKSGKYKVTLTVKDNASGKCNVSQDTLNVILNHPPIANAGPNRACCVNKPVVLDASGSSDPDGDSLEYLWDFGDGNIQEGKQVTHSYAQVGEYKVNLIVKDNSGVSGCDSATAGFLVKAEQMPVAVMEIQPYRRAEK